MPILTQPRNKVGAELEPIQTRLLQRTSCRGVATWTLWNMQVPCLCLTHVLTIGNIPAVCWGVKNW